MRIVVFHQYTKVEVCRPCRSEDYGAQCVSALIGLVTLTFDLLILKLVCESHQRWGTFLPNLGTLGLWVLELFAMYTTDGRTDRQTDGRTKAKLIVPFPTGGAIISDLGVFALPHFLWVIVGLRLVVNTSAVSCLE